MEIVKSDDNHHKTQEQKAIVAKLLKEISREIKSKKVLQSIKSIAETANDVISCNNTHYACVEYVNKETARMIPNLHVPDKVYERQELRLALALAKSSNPDFNIDDLKTTKSGLVKVHNLLWTDVNTLGELDKTYVSDQALIDMVKADALLREKARSYLDEDIPDTNIGRIKNSLISMMTQYDNLVNLIDNIENMLK